MSISPTVGGMHDILTQIKENNKGENVKLLESFGLTYLGVKNGNDVDEMIDALQEAKTLLKEQSVLLHISTKKGKGYEFSEEDPTTTHGVPPVLSQKDKEYSEVLGSSLCELAKNNDKITVVSAAMKESLGLTEFFKTYPERAFDVGICEENACVLCAAMATQGIKPYYAIYSTFLQRSFDEIIHDVCGMDLPVTFCIDRAGISGADGETHQGVFDLSYLSMIPNLTVIAPKDTEEFKAAIKFSAEYSHPLAIRYPRAGQVLFEGDGKPFAYGKWEYLRFAGENASITLLATGERNLLLAMKILNSLGEHGKKVNLVNARFVKPLDKEMLLQIKSPYIVTMEDNVLRGGFGESVGAFVLTKGTGQTVKMFAYQDEFIPHGSVPYLQKKYGVDEEEIRRYIEERI
jgi:1-deoxy-D-xylulose-5-phosphate synthase